MRKILASALAIIYTSFIWAACGPSITQSTIGNGLESQTLNVLAKDRLGRLWVGSDVGISLISNGTVTNIREIVSGGGLVMLGNVNCIVCTNTALIACDDRILHYDSRNSFAETLKYNDVILHTKSLLLEGDVVIFYDRDTRSLYSYDMETAQCSLLTSFTGQEDYDFVKILRAESDPETLYLADDKLGLYRFDRKSGSLSHIQGTDRPIIAKATVIDRTNVIWLSVPSDGIKGYYINSNYEKVAQYNTRNSRMPSDDVTFMASLPDGNLITGHSEDGACLIERNSLGGNRTDFSIYEGLKNITSTLVNTDDKETLYATSGFGLISLKKTFIGQIHHIYEQEDGIINFENYISAFEEPEGTVILGTMRNGLCRIDPLTHEKSTIKGTDHLRIISMCRFDDSSILMADASGQILLFNRLTGRVSRPEQFSAIQDIASTGMTNVKMAIAENGNIFIFNVGSRHFVYKRSQDILEELSLSDEGQPVRMVENVCATAYAVYTTCRGSIIEVDYNTLLSKCVYHNRHKIVHNITSLDANSQGELFFTEPDGLHRYDPRSNFDESLAETWGNGRFMNVAVDTKDRIWFTTTNEYIHMYDPGKKELLLYSVEDGVPSSRFLNHFSFCTRSGIILFPNVMGMVTINTDGSLMYDTPPVDVVCTSARTDKKDFTHQEVLNSVDRPLRMPSKYRELNLEFSANSFNPTYPHFIIYNIFRDDILVRSVSTTGTSITIPRLDNGKYNVVIRQAYRKGLTKPQTIVRFKVPRPFLGTIPGVLTALFLMLLFGYSIAKFSSNREKNRLEKAIAAQDIKNREDKIAFLSNIAHELRTPLSLIYNPVKDFLQEKSVDGIDYERMERIFNQVNKMTVMVNMILDSSRADVNKADILIEEVNLNEWLNFLLEDYRIDCYGTGFSLKFIMDNNIGIVSIDKRIIETGLSNMVNNAIKYSSPGTTITVSTEKAGETIRVSVKDQGRGFSCDPEDLFKRYYRENTDSNIPGYGLGLPYARLQLSLIGGVMSAFNNEDGVGSTFFMEFPVVADKKYSTSKTTESGSAGTSSVSAPSGTADSTLEGLAQDFDTGDMTILFVSADKRETLSFNSEFEDMFRSIQTASSGKEAVNLLKGTDIDLVVSDIDMPEMDGFELCRHIKSTLEISHIPVILLTSRTDERNKTLGYKMGADAFIPKPYDVKQMYALIRSQLGGRFEIKRQYNFGFFSKMSLDQTFSVTDEEFIGSLNSLIDQFISDPSFDEDYILKQTDIKRNVMLRKMKGLLGTDLANYLTRIKVSIIKDKLTGTDDDLESIAKQTGFASVDAMNKTFKRETGKTVQSVRQQ